jgi:hypothetical protein
MLKTSSRKTSNSNRLVGTSPLAIVKKATSKPASSLFGLSCKEKVSVSPVSSSCKKTLGRQQQLAVARSCRDCGLRLTALEDALHFCSAVLEWPFGAEVTSSTVNNVRLSTSSASSSCRIIRLSANAFREGSSCAARLTELWHHVQDGDLSHSLELPSANDVASGRCSFFLSLRGKEVLGLLSAEHCSLSQVSRHRISSRNDPLGAKDQVAGRGLDELKATDSLLGVALIWVRRSERRRGVATMLLEAARQASGVARERVAFSQPTELGFSFASAYEATGPSVCSEFFVYEPTV